MKTIDMPASFATLIAFLSFIDPPGWIIAPTPKLANSSIPSGKGKKASDAATEFLILSFKNSKAFLEAILQLSSLLGCPEPIPIVDFPLAKTIAFDLTNLQILKANFKLSIWLADGFFLVTTFNFFSKRILLGSCDKNESPKKR